MNCKELAVLSPLYHSGELDASRTAQFAGHLEACPECSREIAEQARFDGQLRKSILAEDVDTAALELLVHQRIAAESKQQLPIRTSRSLSRRWMIAAAAIAGLLLVAAIGHRFLLGPRTARVYAAAALDHYSEVVEQQPRPWRYDLAAIGSLAEQQGIPASSVVALAPEGFHVQRAKLCRLDGRLYLHLVYADNAHEFSIFLRQQDAGRLPGRAEETVNGRLVHSAFLNQEQLAGFQTGHLTALIVTAQSGVNALQLARFAAGVL